MRPTLIGLICLGLIGCASEEEAACPYSGGSFSCSQGAQKAVGSSGLCDSVRTATELRGDCEKWDPAFRGCWTTCVQNSSTCARAMACEDDCYSCGR